MKLCRHLDSGSECNIEKSRLISLLEDIKFDYAGWSGEVVKRGNIFRHLGAPLGEGTTFNQALNWFQDRLKQKIKRWENILVPFECRIRIINMFLIPYITFASPILQLSNKNWKVFLKPIKEFMWRNNLTGAKPWQWGKWEMMAIPQIQRGS